MHSLYLKFPSIYLERPVDVSCYFLSDQTVFDHLIIINDGQDLPQMDISALLRQQVESNGAHTLIVGCAAAIGDQRKQEYGVQWAEDYAGRGAKANLYAKFITEELITWIENKFRFSEHVHRTIAGWSLGGLSAIDIAWHAPQLFKKAGVFSGSFWWRNPHLIIDDVHHRLMHHKVKHTPEPPRLKLWFQAGTNDEKADRNKNGIIDVIDDTLDLMSELEAKGYKKGDDMQFHIEQGGNHDVQTWAKVMPLFMAWVTAV
ncbi:MAG: alpha/beta hydrolase-fold protein [Saprospiraceae bacterium]